MLHCLVTLKGRRRCEFAVIVIEKSAHMAPRVFELTGLVLTTASNYLLRHTLQDMEPQKYFELCELSK